jgi:LacI family repressor for deo operon, udp, cdd, tsx, nupC, and nupG
MDQRNPITIADIAKAAQVSVSTVSRTLNRRDGSIKISQATQERVLEAAKRLGYQPNPFAAALRTQRTGVLGAILRDIGDPFLSLLVRALQRAVHRENFELLLGHAAYDRETAERQLAFMLNSWFDGLFLLGNWPGDSALIGALAQQPRPYVGVACGTDHSAFSVSVDEVQGTHKSLDYLYALGHRRIAFLGNVEHAGVPDRLACFRRFVSEHALEWHHGYEQLYLSKRSDAAAHVTALLRLDSPPTALFCASDLLALGAISGVWQMGKRIPEDLSIFGFDDIEEATDVFPPLSTVRQPVEEMARQATELIGSLMDGSRRDRETLHVLIQPELVIRGSCSAPAS